MTSPKEEEWRKTFKVFYDDNKSGGSSRWLVTPQTVENFISSLLLFHNKELVEKLEGMKYTFKKVDWGDGIISDEPVERDDISFAEARGFNTAIDDILSLLSTKE